MTSLLEYDFLVNEVFYRGWHILDWVTKHPDMDPLDREAICNTIMDALVYKGLIDPEKQSLDLDNLNIVNNLDYFKYNKTPFVMSYPQWLRDKFRRKCIIISGSIPVSIFLAKPASKVSHYCVFDPNTCVSSFFDEFSFLLVDYDSPTRVGEKATDRPFVEVPINGVNYLVDILTRRLFEREEFAKRYNMVVKQEFKKSKFDKRRREIYEEQTTDTSNSPELFGSYISLALPLFEGIKTNPDFAEMKYELEKSKEIFPKGWEESEILNQMVANFPGSLIKNI